VLCIDGWLEQQGAVNIKPGFHSNASHKRKPQETQALALASSQSWLQLLRPSIPIGRRLRLLREIFTQQTQAPANRNARSKQLQPWLAACQRKRLRFLRFSFMQRTYATQAIAFEWKPGLTVISAYNHAVHRDVWRMEFLYTLEGRNAVLYLATINTTYMYIVRAALHGHVSPPSIQLGQHCFTWTHRLFMMAGNWLGLVTSVSQ